MINNIIDGWFTSLATSTLKGVIKPLVVCQLAGQNCLMNEIKQLQSSALDKDSAKKSQPHMKDSHLLKSKRTLFVGGQ